MTRFWITLPCALALTACGFEPVYGPAQGFSASSGVIQIQGIPGRTGHRLRQELVRTVGGGLPGMDGPGVLTIDLNENLGRLAFQPDEAASRTDLVASAAYELTDEMGVVIASGSIVEETSFNVPMEPFGDISAQTEARERVALLLARRLRERLVVDARNYADAQAAAASVTE
ncbi:MAG: hypothetical protein AAF719_07475 [Pseudomonadota bacterium]